MTFKITQGRHECDILLSDRGCAIHRRSLYVYLSLYRVVLIALYMQCTSVGLESVGSNICSCNARRTMPVTWPALVSRQRRTCSWHRVTWWLDAADSALWWIPSTDVIVMLAIQPTMPSVWSDDRRDHGRPPSDTHSVSYSHQLLLMIIIRYTSK